MALSLVSIEGKAISTEKYRVRVLQSLPLTYPTAILEIRINTLGNLHTLEHLPILGTNDTFDFEINSIVKDYFASEFLPLTGANQTAIENAIVSLRFRQVDVNGVIDAAILFQNVFIKNITQDTFEIEDFVLADYDCGDAGSAISKLLTSSPSPLPIADLTSVHVSCLTTSYNVLVPKQEWFIQTLLNGVVVTTTSDAVNVPDRSMLPDIAVGKYDISTYRFDFDSSTGIDEVRFYVRDIANPFTIRSETKIYKLRDDCEKTMTLSWLNEFGAQDSFTFAGNINRVGKYTDSTFKRIRPVTPVSTDVGDLVYKSSYNYEYDLFSDRMPENTVQWLSNILINKRAAIQQGGQNCFMNLTNDQYFGSMPSLSSYANLVDAGNGFAYGAPGTSGNFIKYDLANDIITTVASAVPSGGSPQYATGVLSPTNGKIYYMNFFATDILVFDPSTETYITFGVLTDRVGRPVVTEAGIIYANIENGSGKVFKIDTNTNIIVEINTGLASGTGDAVYTKTGFVYFMAGAAGEFYKLDTRNDNFTTVLAPAKIGGVSSSTLTSSGKIYSTMPLSAPDRNYVFVVDTFNDTSFFLDTGVTTNSAYAGIFTTSDGNVFLLGWLDPTVLKLDTTTNLFTQVATINSAQFIQETVIGNNVYSIGELATDPVLKLTFTNTCTGQKYFPIVITTDETTLEDKFSPETLFRLKFRLANRRKGLK